MNRINLYMILKYTWLSQVTWPLNNEYMTLGGLDTKNKIYVLSFKVLHIK